MISVIGKIVLLFVLVLSLCLQICTGSCRYRRWYGCAGDKPPVKTKGKQGEFRYFSYSYLLLFLNKLYKSPTIFGMA